MKNENETVLEVVNAIKLKAKLYYAGHVNGTGSEFDDFADRVESAFLRYNTECKYELFRLREALKPILDVKPEKSWIVEKDGSTVFKDKYGAETLVTAVRKAQEIMRGVNA